MLPEIRDIILEDERIKEIGFIVPMLQEGFVTVWKRDSIFVGNYRLLDNYERNWGRTLTVLRMEMDWDTPDGGRRHTTVDFVPYLLRGLDDNGEWRR